jgi:hypothetical protein
LSAGQLDAVPVQAPATSQIPADARQTVPLAANKFGGQLAEIPVHVSATSHTSAAARQTVPAAAS